MSARLALLIKADAGVVKRSHPSQIGKGRWKIEADGEVKSKLSICYRTPNGLPHITVLDRVIEGPAVVEVIIDEGIKGERLTIFAQRQHDPHDPKLPR